jgi:hypothetical protein
MDPEQDVTETEEVAVRNPNFVVGNLPTPEELTRLAIDTLLRHVDPQSRQGLGAFSHGHLMPRHKSALKLTLFRVLHSWAVTPTRNQWTG